jgi:methyl-accepting chemotaxis protein
VVAAVVQHGEDEAVISVEVAGATESLADRLAALLAERDMRVIWAGLGTLARGERVELDGVAAVTVQLCARGPAPTVQISQNIDRARTMSEKSVLAIGQEVQSVCTLAREHVSTLTALSRQVLSNSESSVVGSLMALTEQVRAVRGDLLERADRQAHGVARAQTWTGDIMRLGQSINDIAASARILTFNARVESARIGEQGKGFSVIAQSIQDLAAQIRAANQSVTSLVQRLASSLPELHAEAQAIARTITTDTARFEQELTSVQHVVEAERSSSSQAIEQQVTTAAEMKTRVEKVITALQFQQQASELLTEATQQCSQLLEWTGLEEHVDAKAEDTFARN